MTWTPIRSRSRRTSRPRPLRLNESSLLCCLPGRKAGLNNLDAQLGVEVAKAQELRPHALVGHQRVNADVGAHPVELCAEHWALPDLLPAAASDQ